jgi:uncharacterized membrane protein YhaH (DUF805 family)
MSEVSTRGKTKALIWLEGRCDRREYWMWVAPLVVLGVIASLVIGKWAGLVNLPIAYVIILVSIRRFHDLGWSGFAVIPLFLLMFLGSYLLPAAFGDHQGPILSFTFAQAVRATLGIFAGQPHANKFGPPPGKPKPGVAEVFS